MKVTTLKRELVYEGAKILIVDDQPANVDLLERILRRAGYHHLHSTTKPMHVIPLFLEHRPDIVLLDLHMPDMNGLEILQRLSPLVPTHVFLPIVVLTADITAKAKREALLLGAHDYLTKPLDGVEVLLRIRNLLRTRFLSLAEQEYNRTLEGKVKQRTHELELAQSAIIECLARASEYRDDTTGEHARRVGYLSEKLAVALGYGSQEAAMIGAAASLHDIGKIGISDGILQKPGRLTADEYDVMKMHTVIGAEIIAEPHFPLLQYARNIVYSHHEKWDGTGYPQGLSGDEIPLEGQIVSIVDVFDALTHDRPYKSAWSAERALVEIASQSGRHFSPKVVKAFLSVLVDIEDAERQAATGKEEPQ